MSPGGLRHGGTGLRVSFVVNPAAGPRGRSALRADDLLDAARTEGIDATLRVLEPGEDAEDVGRAASASADVVAAVGGDGTASAVARGLLGTGVALAVVPRGSGNGLARALGMSADPARAVAQIARGRRRAFDAADASGSTFFLTIGFGIDARVAHRFHAEARDRRGALPYFTLALRAALAYEPPRLRFEAGGEIVDGPAFLLAGANVPEWGSGARVAPGATPGDGLLDFVLAGPPGLLGAARLGARLFSGTLDLDPRVRIVRAARARVSGPGPLEAQIDGEPVVLPAETVIRVLPGAIAVQAP